MNKAILFALLIIASTAAFSQSSNNIMGVAADSASQFPLPGANVIVLSARDSSFLAGAATDIKGRFILGSINENSIRIRISIIGYKTKLLAVNLDKEGPDIGNIYLSPSVYSIGEAVVQAQKPMIEYFADKQVVNIERAPEAGGSVSDALRSTGAVDVDPATNKISIRGGSDTRIWIDGKPAQMTDDMLAQLPASAVDRVEIISNPSAKNDPEGDSGIINIITKKDGLGTFSGSASLSLSTRKMNNGSAVLNYKINDLTLFGNVSGFLVKNDRFSESKNINYLSSARRYNNRNEKSDNEVGAFYGRLGFDYDVDTMTLISFTGAFLNNDVDGTGAENSRLLTANFISNDSSYNNTSKRDLKRNEFNISGFYRKKFNTKGHELTMDGYAGSMEFVNGNDYSAVYSYKQEFPELQQNKTNTDNITAIYKADYVNPASFGKLEAGYSLTFRDRTDAYETRNYSYLEQGWIDSLNLSNEFNYKESIHALYGMYSNSAGAFDYRAGIRIEQAYTEGDQRATGRNFRTDYLSWYPFITLSYKVWENFPIALNASKRIIRPQMDMINPFVSKTSPVSYYIGNPEIDPTYVYLYELSFERYLKFYYTSTKGTPTRISAADKNGIYTTTVINLNSNKSYGAESFLAYIKGSPKMPFNLPKWISMLRLNAAYYRRETKGFYIVNGLMEDLNGKSDNWRLNAGINLNLWYDVNYNMYLNYIPKNNDMRERNSSRIMLYAGFSKSLFDRKLNIRINLLDLLNTGKEYSSEVFADTYYTYYRSVSSIGRSASISVTYSFNNYKPKEDREVGDGRDNGEGMGGM